MLCYLPSGFLFSSLFTDLHIALVFEEGINVAYAEGSRTEEEGKEAHTHIYFLPFFVLEKR